MVHGLLCPPGHRLWVLLMSAQEPISVPVETARLAESRFWSYVEIAGPDDCWAWTGGKTRGGYGIVFISKKLRPRLMRVHRLSWTLANGEIPTGQWVLHRCDNPPCVNPAHLFLGSVQDNVDDMLEKGRGDWADGEDHSAARLSDEQVAEIRRRYAAGGIIQRDLAEEFGISEGWVSEVIRGIWRKQPGVAAAPKVLFERTCAHADCAAQFLSDPRKKYCSVECRLSAEAARRRIREAKKCQ